MVCLKDPITSSTFSKVYAFQEDYQSGRFTKSASFYLRGPKVFFLQGGSVCDSQRIRKALIANCGDPISGLRRIRFSTRPVRRIRPKVCSCRAEVYGFRHGSERLRLQTAGIRFLGCAGSDFPSVQCDGSDFIPRFECILLVQNGGRKSDPSERTSCKGPALGV